MSKPFLVKGTPVTSEFVSRPNRFVVLCRLENGSVTEAFMPNPGRLRELLIPGARMLLENTPTMASRRTRFTAAAVYRDDVAIGLNTLQANSIVSYLIKNRMVPGLEEVRLIASEVTHGRSRFDFLVEDKTTKRFFLEVKSVTLYGNGVAMFPDAVTTRGSRHLLELAELSVPETQSMVLFLVQGTNLKLLMPDYHTDLTFARNMFQVRDRVRYLPVAIGWGSDLRLAGDVELLDIPWTFISGRLRDTGAYLLILKINQPRVIEVGSLGRLVLHAGYYIYVGSGMNGLSMRLARHLRKRKKLRWNIDYLRDVADNVEVFPIRSPNSIELKLASEVARLYGSSVPGFGFSDSPLKTHLFFSHTNPETHQAFQNIIQRFRFLKP